MSRFNILKKYFLVLFVIIIILYSNVLSNNTFICTGNGSEVQSVLVVIQWKEKQSLLLEEMGVLVKRFLCPWQNEVTYQKKKKNLSCNNVHISYVLHLSSFLINTYTLIPGLNKSSLLYFELVSWSKIVISYCKVPWTYYHHVFVHTI